MFQGNWTCSVCGAAITELPFEPRSTDGLKCKDCHQKSRGDSRGGAGGGRDRNRSERKMFQGDWKCSECGAAITELPFMPKDTSNLKCKDCFRKN